MVTGLAQPPRLDFPDHDTLYATHALHAFAAKCPPPLVRWALDEFTEPGDTVVDPMVGSGTTLVEAVLCGRHAIGADIDPLARLIAKVKATPIATADLDRAASAVLRGFAEERARSEPESLEYPHVHQLDRWFLPSVARDLAVLKRCIRRADVDDAVRDFLFVAFSSLITARTSVANARDLVHSRHHYREHPTPPDVGAIFRRRLAQMQRQMAAFVLTRQAAPGPATASVIPDDARSLTVADGSADLVFTSPPYCNALDYTRAHAFSIGWLHLVRHDERLLAGLNRAQPQECWSPAVVANGSAAVARTRSRRADPVASERTSPCSSEYPKSRSLA